jgi:type I restriction enzyme S subunit
MFKKEKYPIIRTSSLVNIAKSHSLRCDSKQSETRFSELDAMVEGKDVCFLSEFLPEPLVKGTQPVYLQEEKDIKKGVPIINTLSIQKMKINQEDCRFISKDAFNLLNKIRILRKGDVLLTMDGGTSIGKPVLFNLDGNYSIDPHVAILRPKGISPKALVYLLASPIGQLQFQRFESGASGQTAVTEEDIRRFLIPKSAVTELEKLVVSLDKEKIRIENVRIQLKNDESIMWEEFSKNILK